MKHVAVIGGGFAGIAAARALLGHFSVTMISKSQYFVYLPLMHEVAAGKAHVSESRKKITDIICHKDFSFINAEVTALDLDSRKIKAGREIEYDYLIISTGARINYWGVEGAESCHDLYSIKSTLETKDALEDMAGGQEIVVVGAGPTGIELAADIASRYDNSIRVINGLPHILPGQTAPTREKVRKRLQELNIEVDNETFVKKVKGKNLTTSKGKISADIIIWSGGSRPNGIGKHKDGYKVDQYLRLNKTAYAVGDCAIKPERIPAVAQAAIQQGRCAAQNIIRSEQEKPLKRFVFNNKGMLLSLGDRYAAGEIDVFGKKITVSGFFPWVLKRIVYVLNFRLL